VGTALVSGAGQISFQFDFQEWCKNSSGQLILGINVFQVFAIMNRQVIKYTRMLNMEYWNVGDRAFAYWDADDYFYPAAIVEIEGDDIYIRFDSGEEEWTNADYLEAFVVEVDDEVECMSAQDDQYYDVLVLDVKGEEVQVEFEDGTTEWNSLSRVRFFVDET
jgi:hypothetical protein